MCLQFSGQDAEQKYIDIRMNAVKRKILVLSGKGGVGKSSIACNLAIALTRLSKKVIFARQLHAISCITCVSMATTNR